MTAVRIDEHEPMNESGLSVARGNLKPLPAQSGEINSPSWKSMWCAPLHY